MFESTTGIRIECQNTIARLINQGMGTQGGVIALLDEIVNTNPQRKIISIDVLVQPEIGSELIKVSVDAIAFLSEYHDYQKEYGEQNWSLAEYENFFNEFIVVRRNPKLDFKNDIMKSLVYAGLMNAKKDTKTNKYTFSLGKLDKKYVKINTDDYRCNKILSPLDQMGEDCRRTSFNPAATTYKTANQGHKTERHYLKPWFGAGNHAISREQAFELSVGRPPAPGESYQTLHTNGRISTRKIIVNDGSKDKYGPVAGVQLTKRR